MAVTSPPSITALPNPPDPDDRANFNTLAYPWSVAQQTFATEVAAVATNVFNNATDAATSATSALASSTSAVAAANYKGAWSSLSGALAIPATVIHSGAIWLLTASVADVTAHTPGVSANWFLVQGPRQFLHFQDSKTSGTNAQSISATTWTKRECASVSNTITGASITTSVITLPAGRFRIDVSATGIYVAASAGHQRLRLRDTATPTTVLAGPNMSVIGTNTIAPMLNLRGVFTLSASRTLEVQHYVTTTGGVAGAALTTGEAEIYMDCIVEYAPA